MPINHAINCFFFTDYLALLRLTAVDIEAPKPHELYVKVNQTASNCVYWKLK